MKRYTIICTNKSNCNTCGKLKIRNKIKRDKFKTLVFIDENENIWTGLKCPQCVKTERLKNKKQPIENTCMVCSKVFKSKYRPSKVCSPKCRVSLHSDYYIEYRNRKKGSYKRNCGICDKEFITTKPHKKTCSPECSKKLQIRRCNEDTRRKRPKTYCKVCKNEIIGQGRRVYCSNECKESQKKKYYCIVCDIEISKGKYCKDHKPVYQKYIPQELTCPTCGKNFLGKNSRSKYCRDKCRPSYKTHKKANKRLRNRAERQRRLNVPYMKIEKIYNNCPEGYQVDHIIPLNHPKVSGLHVPWNLQYLSIDDNVKKNNKFDDTYDNNGWKLG